MASLPALELPPLSLLICRSKLDSRLFRANYLSISYSRSKREKLAVPGLLSMECLTFMVYSSTSIICSELSFILIGSSFGTIFDLFRSPTLILTPAELSLFTFTVAGAAVVVIRLTGAFSALATWPRDEDERGRSVLTYYWDTFDSYLTVTGATLAFYGTGFFYGEFDGYFVIAAALGVVFRPRYVDSDLSSFISSLTTFTSVFCRDELLFTGEGLAAAATGLVALVGFAATTFFGSFFAFDSIVCAYLALDLLRFFSNSGLATEAAERFDYADACDFALVSCYLSDFCFAGSAFY